MSNPHNYYQSYNPSSSGKNQPPINAQQQQQPPPQQHQHQLQQRGPQNNSGRGQFYEAPPRRQYQEQQQQQYRQQQHHQQLPPPNMANMGGPGPGRSQGGPGSGRSQGGPGPGGRPQGPSHGYGPGSGQVRGPPMHQNHNQPQQLPPLRQPEKPTLNLNRDFSDAEELLKTLQQFNQSCDIFNNFEMPGDIPAEFDDDLAYTNTGAIDFQRLQQDISGGRGPSQQQHHQGRHQLQQNNYYPLHQSQHLLPPLKQPTNLPADVFGEIIKSGASDELISSLGGNFGGGNDDGFSQSYQQPPRSRIPQQQQQPMMNSSQVSGGSDWGSFGDQSPKHNGSSASNDYTSTPLGTSGWGPPPGAQQSNINFGSGNTNTSPRQDPPFVSQNHPNSNSPRPRNYNAPVSNSQRQGHRMSDPVPKNPESPPRWNPSPYATEFVPKVQASSNGGGSTEDALASGIAQMGFPDQQGEYQNDCANPQSTYQHHYGGGGDADGYLLDDTAELNDVFVLDTVSEAINNLCAEPAKFSRLVKDMTQVLQNYLHNPEILGIVVTLIIEQSISTPNFRYTAARLCQAFHESDIKVGTLTFKNALLSFCQEEHVKLISHEVLDNETADRAHGFLMVLAELYVNFRNKRQLPVGVFGVAALELMTYLLKAQKQNYEIVKCVAQVLKLIGWEFEHSVNSLIKEQMESIMKELSYALAMTTDSRVRTIIENLVELKKRGWDKTDDSSASEGDEDDGQAINNSYGQTSGPVLYDIPDSDEDSDERYPDLDDEPEEVRRFYEQCLAEVENKRKV